MSSKINIFDLKCNACGHHFCFTCNGASHFPALCEEKRWWDAREQVMDSSRREVIESIEGELAELDNLRDSVESKRVSQGIFNADLSEQIGLTIDGMIQMVDLVRWGFVILASNPWLRGDILCEILAIRNGIQNLIVNFPSRSNASIFRFTCLWIDAINSVLAYLVKLVSIRSNGGKEVLLLVSMWEVYFDATADFPSPNKAEDDGNSALVTSINVWKRL